MAEFLAQNRIIGSVLSQDLAHHLFGGAVRHRHRIIPAGKFALRVKCIAPKERQDNRARRVRHQMRNAAHVRVKGGMRHQEIRYVYRCLGNIAQHPRQFK